MRLLITGWQGQVAQSLIEVAAGRKDVEALAIGRPALDLVSLPTILRALSDHRPDVVINTAAYTAVDKAESEPEAAFALNRDGAARLAEATAARNLPLIHLSTDYVFNGQKPSPYGETDPTAPLGVYGRSKLEGEQAVAAGNSSHIIMRTAWVVSPFGLNFVKTMLRLGKERGAVRVVNDQIGSPTYAPDLAATILDVAATLNSTSPWGIYNAAGGGEATWHGVAKVVFERASELGMPPVTLTPITTADYPTPARRPSNSRLDCGKLYSAFGLALPDWKPSVRRCVDRLMIPAA